MILKPSLAPISVDYFSRLGEICVFFGSAWWNDEMIAHSNLSFLLLLLLLIIIIIIPFIIIIMLSDSTKSPPFVSLQQLKNQRVFRWRSMFRRIRRDKSTGPPHQNNNSKRGWRLPWTTWRLFASDVSSKKWMIGTDDYPALTVNHLQPSKTYFWWNF